MRWRIFLDSDRLEEVTSLVDIVRFQTKCFVPVITQELTRQTCMLKIYKHRETHHRNYNRMALWRCHHWLTVFRCFMTFQNLCSLCPVFFWFNGLHVFFSFLKPWLQLLHHGRSHRSTSVGRGVWPSSPQLSSMKFPSCHFSSTASSLAASLDRSSLWTARVMLQRGRFNKRKTSDFTAKTHEMGQTPVVAAWRNTALESRLGGL